MIHSKSYYRWLLILASVLLLGLAHTASAQTIRLKDGRVLVGKVLPITGVADNPIDVAGSDSEAKSTPILLVDDDLRRVFVPKFSLGAVVDQTPETQVKINLSEWQNVAQSGGAIGSVGPSLGIGPFDKWGRRIYRMQTSDGPLAVVQGITELTPRYAKVEGLRGQPRPVVWDMRLATSSIPREKLAEILANAVSHDDPQDWLQVVRFYLQAERFLDARLELEQIIRRFPEMQQLKDQSRELLQLSSRRILKEIELRSEAGQHKLVDRLLANFPTEDDVASETLQQVRETIERYSSETAKLEQVEKLLAALVAKIESEDQRQLLAPIVGEINKELTRNNLPRLVPFLQLVDDESLSAEQRVALAISGWMLGADGASQEISLATSLVEVRAAVLAYLREPAAHKRIELLQSIESAEGAGVPDVAKLLAHMKPPWEIPAGADRKFGVYELTAPGKTENGDFNYTVQLPPEYDAYRRYPTLVVLNGAYNSVSQELDFWASSPPRDAEGNATGHRAGQAMRYGYITIAVEWQKPHQYHYEYSLREHEAVLSSLRDATRRFSIDTDRVFLSGHGIGGNAAWDFAQSHPDLWAGVIPFVAELDSVKKYLQHYWENSQYVSLYFVAGEKDGRKMSENAELFDRYLRKRYDTTVVEYLGRGHEPFHDEILYLFEWMALPNHRRLGAPSEFTCKTMRPWDNFFWWIEGQGFDKLVFPEEWPLRGARANTIDCRVPSQNILWAKSTSEQTTIWLSPDLVDFSQPIEIKYNGRKLPRDQSSVSPSLEVLLEDVRTRADRFRPFWAKIEIP